MSNRKFNSDRNKKGQSVSICQPNSPWIALKPSDSGRAALSFYYSDPRSDIPVREISHKNDPKGDPNIETLTFGLFSVCDKPMRATIAKEGISLHFFCTNRSGSRVLSGYYEYGWYYELPRTKDDYMLKAKEARFVSPGFPLNELTPYLRGIQLNKRFRTFRYIDSETANLLLLLLKDTPNAIDQYLSEIRRLEKASLKRDGYLYQGKYPNGFSWEVAWKPMKLKPKSKPPPKVY